jgi:hypothetical protein
VRRSSSAFCRSAAGRSCSISARRFAISEAAPRNVASFVF